MVVEFMNNILNNLTILDIAMIWKCRTGLKPVLTTQVSGKFQQTLVILYARTLSFGKTNLHDKH